MFQCLLNSISLTGAPYVLYRKGTIGYMERETKLPLVHSSTNRNSLKEFEMYIPFYVALRLLLELSKYIPYIEVNERERQN